MQKLAKDLTHSGKEHTKNLIAEYFPELFESTSQQPHAKVTDSQLLMAPKVMKFDFEELHEFQVCKSTLTGSNFWKLNKNNFKNLYKLYKRLRPIQFTNACIERLFSRANLVFDDLSASMDTEMILARLIIDKNGN